MNEDRGFMWWYYIGGAGLALVLFLVCFFISWIVGTVKSNQKIDEVEETEKNTIVIQYYDDDDLDFANVYYLRVEKRQRTPLVVPVTEEDVFFAGYYDGPDPKSATCYADANGNMLVSPVESIVLYPVFERGAS